MNKRKIFWFSVPLIALIGVGAAGAGYKHYRGYHGPERMVERVSEALDLDEKQRQKLEVVKEALLESKQEMRREREEVVNQLIGEIRKPELDQVRVMELIDQRKARLDALAPRVLGPVIEFHKSLDPEQRERIVNLLETFRDWGHEHRRGG